MESKVAQELVTQVLYRMDESSRMVKIALRNVTEEEIWKRPNGASNSIGNLLLHLCGNMHQYAVSSLGKKEDIRERDKEFAIKGGMGKAELLKMLMDTVESAQEVISMIPVEEMMRNRKVQGFQLSGIGIMIHVTEHYSYHTGQIAFWAKQLRDQDLGFYSGIELGTKNEL
ncbi:MAG: DinB family protein [Bacteroidota bacterium]